MKVESYLDFRKLFQLDWLAALSTTQGISIRALCSGGILAVISSISPLVPRARHCPSNSLVRAAACSGVTTQQYDTQPLKVEAVMGPFGCTIANTKEEDVLIYINIYNMTVLLFKTHTEIK